jgi:hypothetical protein
MKGDQDRESPVLNGTCRIGRIRSVGMTLSNSDEEVAPFGPSHADRKHGSGVACQRHRDIVSMARQWCEAVTAIILHQDDGVE